MNDESLFPKVLVLAVNPISQVQSNGLLMRSLFLGWPRQRLAQVYFPFFHRFPPDGSTCSRYLRINPMGFGRLQEFPEDRRERDAEAGTTRLTTLLRGLTRRVRFRAWILDPLREILTINPLADRQILEFARAFQPDVIYTLLGTVNVARTAALVASEVGCPIVPHFTDHWIETKFVGSPMQHRFRRRLRSELEEVLRRSPLVLTVNHSMADAYAERFDTPTEAFTAPVDPELFRDLRRAPRPAGAPLRVRYTGNLGLGRWEILGRVAQALRNLKPSGIDARLEIFCSDEDRRIYGRRVQVPGVSEIQGWVSPDELPGVLAGADILLHVENPDPETLQYTRYSLSTKISHYMMAGRCVLLVGPPEAGSMQEVQQLGGGLVVQPAPLQKLEQSLARLLTDTELRRSMGRQAHRVALDHFEAGKQRERFRRLLNTAAGQPGGGMGPPPP